MFFAYVFWQYYYCGYSKLCASVADSVYNPFHCLPMLGLVGALLIYVIPRASDSLLYKPSIPPEYPVPYTVSNGLFDTNNRTPET